MTQSTITHGLFGRKGDGRKPLCAACFGCCGTSFVDMPEIVYIRTQFGLGLGTDHDYHVPLYKSIRYAGQCDCGSEEGVFVTYGSPLFQYSEFDDNIHDSCCESFALEATCEIGGPCTWLFLMPNPMGYEVGQSTYTEYLDVPADISCNGASGSWQVYINHNGSNCWGPGLGAVTQTFTLSASAPGGTLGTPCTKFCCGSPTTVYVTIDAPDCPAIDGQVVECKYFQSYGLTGVPGTSPNPGGSHAVIWKGRLDISGCGCCGSIPVVVSGNTWSGDAEEEEPLCAWTVTIGSDPTPCVSEQKTLMGYSYCPPLTFSGEVVTGENQCEACCSGTGTITISAELTF